MFGKRFNNDNQQLSGTALESYIVDMTSEGENHAFYELLQHPKINTIKSNYFKMLQLFSCSNYTEYEEYRRQNGQLTEKQLFTLKRLTILSLFTGLDSINMGKVQRQINSSAQEVIQIIFRMSIDGNLSVKINQERGLIEIAYSELRMLPIRDSQISGLKGKIANILNKNNELASQINNIKQKITEKQIQRPQQKPKIFSFADQVLPGAAEEDYENFEN